MKDDNTTLMLQVQKGVNPYSYRIEDKRCEHMLHIMSNCLGTNTGTLVGLTLDETNKKVIRQVIRRSIEKEETWVVYESYTNDKHYDIVYDGIYKDELSILDIISIAGEI